MTKTLIALTLVSALPLLAQGHHHHGVPMPPHPVHPGMHHPAPQPGHGHPGMHHPAPQPGHGHPGAHQPMPQPGHGHPGHGVTPPNRPMPQPGKPPVEGGKVPDVTITSNTGLVLGPEKSNLTGTTGAAQKPAPQPGHGTDLRRRPNAR